MEEIYAKSGNRILKVEERYLCSRVDPITEARRWVDRVRHHVTGSQGVIILGLGAGYHIVDFCRQFPNKKVLVFEQNKGCRQFSERLFPVELFDLPVLSLTDFKELEKDCHIQKILSGRFCVLEHKPSMELKPQWYENLKETLLGRSLNGLRLHLQFSRGFSGIQKKRLLWLNKNPVNWRIFDPLVDSQLTSIEDQDFYIVRTLRELIK